MEERAITTRAGWPGVADLSGLTPEQAAEWVLARYWDQRLPVAPETMARHMGIRVVVMRGDETSQVCATADGAVEIAVDERDDVICKRFAIAHVFGHILLRHASPPLEARASFTEEAPHPSDRLANRFAMALLMPTEELRWSITSGWIFGIKRIARRFWVSEDLLCLRWHRIRSGA